MPVADKTYVVMLKGDWDRLQEIVRRHPEVLAELRETNIMVQEMTAPSSYVLLNSADEVVATYPREPTLHPTL